MTCSNVFGETLSLTQSINQPGGALMELQDVAPYELHLGAP